MTCGSSLSRPSGLGAAQEDEARFRPGTNKWVAFKVLREAGAEGLSVPQIMARSKQAGLKQWDDNAKRIIQFVRPCRPRPCRMRPVHRWNLQKQDASLRPGRCLCMFCSRCTHFSSPAG